MSEVYQINDFDKKYIKVRPISPARFEPMKLYLSNILCFKVSKDNWVIVYLIDGGKRRFHLKYFTQGSWDSIESVIPVFFD